MKHFRLSIINLGTNTQNLNVFILLIYTCFINTFN